MQGCLINLFPSTDKIEELEGERVTEQGPKSEYMKFLKSGINLMENFIKIFQKADVSRKRKLLSSIFPEKRQIQKNKCRTNKIN